jgi:FlaA1/EpsC-like NDP-sugar epimerase
MFEDKTILVTGGAGSIGSGLIRNLLKHNVKKIVSFDSNETDQFMLKNNQGDGRLEIITADIRNRESLELVFSSHRFDMIYHAAAMKHVGTCEDTPTEAVGANVIGTQNLVDMTVKYRVPKMILISTDKAALPVNVMGATKFIAERIVLNGNRRTNGDLVFSCVRFGNVANTRGSVIPVFVNNALREKPITMTDGNVTRFVMRMDDTVELIFKATRYAKGGEIFILKMNAFRLSDLVESMKTVATKIGIDLEVNETGLVRGEKMHEDLVNNLETANLYEMDGMYVIGPHPENAKRADIINYSSRDAKKLGRAELEAIIMEYIEQTFHYSKIRGS